MEESGAPPPANSRNNCRRWSGDSLSALRDGPSILFTATSAPRPQNEACFGTCAECCYEGKQVQIKITVMI